MNEQQPVDETTWLTALMSPRQDLEFPLFGFDTVSADWTFQRRVLPDHLLYLVTDGACDGDIQGVPVHLEAGSLLWMQPGLRHTFELASRAHPITVYFIRFRLSQRGRGLVLGDLGVQQRDGAWELVELVDDLLDELRTSMPMREMRLRALLAAVCVAVLRSGEAESSTVGTLTRAQRRTIQSHLRQNTAMWPTPRDLAEQVHLSPDYFARLFTRTFGLSPRAWLARERMRRGAHALIESLQTVTEIARSLGYDDVSAFSHQFKQRYGVSPRTYRQSVR